MVDSRRTLPIVSSDERDPVSRLADGDSAGVIEDLERQLAADPADERAWLRLGAVYLAIGHLPEAESALAKSVGLDGDDVEARLLLADVCSRLRKLDAAAYQLIQARRRAPDDPRTHRQLGVVFLEKGLLEKADNSLAEAWMLAPTDAKIPFLRGLVADARSDPATALTHYRRAVELDPESIDARCTLADSMAAMGELAEAARQLEAAQQRDRTSTRIAQNLEILRHALRQLEAHRLIGNGEAAFERSTLVMRAQLKRSGHVDDGAVRYVRYRATLVEAWLAYDGDCIDRILAILPDPAAASATSGDAFEVTVVARSGTAERADFGTGAMLTFLREALGCPMTRASELYGQMLREPSPLVWSGLRLEWREVELGGATLIGLQVSRVPIQS